MMTEKEYCKGCVHLGECNGAAYRYGDCVSGGPHRTNEDYDIDWSPCDNIT